MCRETVTFSVSARLAFGRVWILYAAKYVRNSAFHVTAASVINNIKHADDKNLVYVEFRVQFNRPNSHDVLSHSPNCGASRKENTPHSRQKLNSDCRKTRQTSPL